MVTRKAILLAVVSAVLILGGTTRASGQYSRATPITEAVTKTRDSVLSLNVERRDSKGKSLTSIGTAFIVDERGYAVTNCHVVSGAHRVQAYLPDGRLIRTRVLTEEASYDVAILRLDTEVRLRAAVLGTSADLMIGETVLAIGNSTGLSHTVSRGIVSARGRYLSMPGHAKVSEKGLIQIDAAINPGNSGGPLLNINGEVIGMNFAVRNDAHGVAFAIPVDTVKDVLCRHLSARAIGRIDHDLTVSEEVEEDLDRVQVKVRTATSDGLKPGDRLVRIAGRLIDNRFDVERALWDSKPGHKVDVAIRRDGKTITVSFTPTASRE